MDYLLRIKLLDNADGSDTEWHAVTTNYGVKRHEALSPRDRPSSDLEH